MRVLCPYHPEVHPLTRNALDRYAPATEYVHLGSASDAYWATLSKLWSEKKPFAIIEHDVEIHGSVIRTLQHCTRPWCLFPYGGPPAPAGCKQVLFTEPLGCVRFRANLMKNHPNAIADIGKGNPRPDECHHWRGLDGRLSGTLRNLIDPSTGERYEPHVHWPQVTHHHDYASGCSCGTDHPDIPWNPPTN